MNLEVEMVAGLGLMIWAALPWSRWVKNPRAVMGLHVLKGMLPVLLVRLGLTAEWGFWDQGPAHRELMLWGIGFLTVWMHSVSPLHRGRRPRAMGASAGALGVIAPLALAFGGAAAWVTWRLKREDSGWIAWVEVAGVLGAAAGVLTTVHWTEALWVWAIWWILLLQRQENNLGLILESQNKSARSG